MNFPSLVQADRGSAASTADVVFSAGEALDCLSDGIVATSVGKDPAIVYANPAACEITGYAAEELLGTNPGMLRGPATDPSVTRRLREDLDAGKQSSWSGRSRPSMDPTALRRSTSPFSATRHSRRDGCSKRSTTLAPIH
jgi:PAS domain-containing protein